MHWRIPTVAIVLAAFFALSTDPRAIAQTTQMAGPVADLIQQGDTCAKSREYDKALSFYEKAEKLSHHSCPECLLREITVYKKAGDFGDALGCAKKAQNEAAGDKIEAANACLAQATLLAATASKPKDKKLTEAVADTRQALTLNPNAAIGHFNLGVLLMRQEQDAQGIEELKTYLASNNPAPKTAAEARSYIADPRRAREPYAPDFSFMTLEKTQVSLASLRGRVVLLDFWGSWCPPCRASVPTIASLHKNYAKKDKDVEFFGISSDTDETAWRQFVAAHNMDWPEYIDLDNHVQDAFNVDSYPTYIVLDRNGIIRFRQSGFDEQMTGSEISDAINKALKEKPEPGTAPSSASGTPVASTTAAPPAAGPPATPATNPTADATPAATAPASSNPQPTWERSSTPVQTTQPAQPSPPASTPKAPILQMRSSEGSFSVHIQVATPPNAAAVDWEPFKNAIASSVKSRWLASLPQNPNQGNLAVSIVEIVMNRDGAIGGAPSVARSSGDASLDNAALAAISADSFPKLPDAYTGPGVAVLIFFAYNGTFVESPRPVPPPGAQQ